METKRTYRREVFYARPSVARLHAIFETHTEGPHLMPSNIGHLYFVQGYLDQAEAWYQRALRRTYERDDGPGASVDT